MTPVLTRDPRRMHLATAYLERLPVEKKRTLAEGERMSAPVRCHRRSGDTGRPRPRATGERQWREQGQSEEPTSLHAQNEYFTVNRVVMPASTISELARLFLPKCDQ